MRSSLTYLILLGLGLGEHGSEVHSRHWEFVFLTIIIVVFLVHFKCTFKCMFMVTNHQASNTLRLKCQKRDEENDQLKKCET